MRYIESEAVELKEKFTDVICKDIVAFLNTSGGILITLPGVISTAFWPHS